MALAYDIDGNYVIAGKDAGFVDMEQIRTLPHCLTNGKTLYWYEKLVIHSYNMSIGRKNADIKVDSSVSKMFPVGSQVHCINTKHAMTLSNYGFIKKHRMPSGYTECTMLRLHHIGQYYEAIIDGKCYHLHENKNETRIVDKIQIAYLPYENVILSICWANNKTWGNDPGCEPFRVDGITIFQNPAGDFVAVDDATGNHASSDIQGTIIGTEMNNQSVLIHTTEASYIGSTANTNLVEFVGTLERQIQPTKSARTQAGVHAAKS